MWVAHNSCKSFLKINLSGKLNAVAARVGGEETIWVTKIRIDACYECWDDEVGLSISIWL